MNESSWYRILYQCIVLVISILHHEIQKLEIPLLCMHFQCIRNKRM